MTFPIERLRELLRYDQNTEAMVLINGAPLKSWDNGFGYLKIIIDGVYLYYHRVLWALVHSEWPTYIDHINQDKSDNRLSNLRSVSNQDNGRNCALSKANTSGHAGVYLHPNGKWKAVIMVNYKNIYLGYFDTKPEAVATRKAAEIKHGFHPNHGSRAA